ncbi:stage III sporulation protein AF [Melghiribacillus thermohalophilus]|uniref:Stage III sporulation protein AF n=1 Tax=Melghiribacillus thermohalophilus TaxID=1324956 RepID=A0A4R3N1C4_9BACI|nr:stage III sporulation protein AF [Melghiribacillus thermohalophilus]TCT22625.1 stage III sporulation protein AF [Melghiribacillus thermohalophilus]
MAWINEWVTQIILFLLVALIMELMLPQTSLKKYIKFVLGLILMLIFLQPLFELFRVDMTQIIEDEWSVMEAEEASVTKNQIENKKKEIQASQRAYILNQIAVQLKKQAEGELISQFGVTISDIQLEFTEDTIQNMDQLEMIHVTLKPYEEQGVSTVEEIVIEMDKQPEESEVDMDEIKQTLSSFWEVDQDRINLIWEGGENHEFS